MLTVVHLASSPIPWVLGLELLDLPHSTLMPTVVMYVPPGPWIVTRDLQALTSQ